MNPVERRAVVDSGRGQKRLGIGVVSLVVLGLTLAATAHVAVHAKRIEVAITLGEQERIFRELTLERRHLEIEIGMLKDPARIIGIARDRLGMHSPSPADIRATLGVESNRGRNNPGSANSGSAKPASP